VSTEGFEKSTADAVEEIWRRTRANWNSVGQVVMTDIIDAARAVPVLRQLHGSTSLFTLLFSTCLPHRFHGGIPAIEAVRFNLSPDQPPGPVYIVRARPGGGGEVLGEADDAESAIAILLAHLPADLGPATSECPHPEPRVPASDCRQCDPRRSDDG